MITSIAAPTPALRALAAASEAAGVDLILIGDAASPAGFELEGCDFYGLDRQRALPLELARICPERSYARKNIGYLLAMSRDATVIVETDDDSVAHDPFWRARERSQAVRRVAAEGWTNVYRYFSSANIWPRGFPLDEVRASVPAYESLPSGRIDCPIQQGLVDEDPDVDAVYRLVLDLPFRFDSGPSVALTEGTWCPFNSQNTAWWPEAYSLMYLPSSCSFRMTDIWRSFVAQRIAWANGWGVLFHAATVSQARNVHDLMGDFGDEISGYLENRAICEALAALELDPGSGRLADNMRLAYRRLVEGAWLDERELELLDAWLADVANLASAPAEPRPAATESFAAPPLAAAAGHAPDPGAT